MEKVSLQEFSETAYRAFYWTSFDAKKRAEQTISEHENELNNDLQNFTENRLQIIFDEKPSREIIDLLKKNAFRWSPRFGAWQRQYTNNAIAAAKKVLEQIKNLEQ